MASSPKPSLTEPRNLGKYSKASLPEEEGAKQKRDGRTVDKGEIDVTRECNNCEKRIKKLARSLVCACKLVVYCSLHCQQSSSHKGSCQGKQNRDITKQDLLEYLAQSATHRAANPGPRYDDRINKLEKKMVETGKTTLMLAEAGDPMAAFVIGYSYAERKMCSIKECDDSEWCAAMGHSMPLKYVEKSAMETDEIAIKWLKIAAEAGIPEAMLCLAEKLQEDGGLVTDKRVAHHWLTKAYNSGEMDELSLSDILENVRSGNWGTLVGEFITLCDVSANIIGKVMIEGPTLSHLLIATRWAKLKDWGSKTPMPMGKSFFGQDYFNKFMENIGKLEAENIFLVSGRAGSLDAVLRIDLVLRSNVVKERKESNIKFMQGVRAPVSPVARKVLLERRSKYLVSCKHHEIKAENQVLGPVGDVMRMTGNLGLDQLGKAKLAGECESCHSEAVKRLHAVSQGHYSISLTEAIPNYGYAARYVDKTGVIVQDIFKSYSRPDMIQVLQFLKSNPADLHPLAVAEDQNLYWPIIWYWGSVFYAIQDTCDQSTLEAVYGKLEGKISNKIRKSAPTSALAAFPESAAGEWRIACGSEDCPRVDHEVKLSQCQGCKVRKYCNEICQRKDWPKHKNFCKAGRDFDN